MTDSTKSAISAIEAKHNERKAHLASYRAAQAEKRDSLLKAKAAEKKLDEKKPEAAAVKQVRAR